MRAYFLQRWGDPDLEWESWRSQRSGRWKWSTSATALSLFVFQFTCEMIWDILRDWMFTLRWSLTYAILAQAVQLEFRVVTRGSAQSFFSHPPLPFVYGSRGDLRTYELRVWTGFWCFKFWSDLISLPVQTLAAHWPNAWPAWTDRKKDVKFSCCSCCFALLIYFTALVPQEPAEWKDQLNVTLQCNVQCSFAQAIIGYFPTIKSHFSFLFPLNSDFWSLEIAK